MSRPRLLFYVQHLLGIGHLVRASRVARASAEELFDVTVVIGGERPPGLDFGRAEILCLPPVRAGSGGFADLVTPDGRVFEEADRSARRDMLLDGFHRLRPDVLLIEAFPFGRRQMRFELLPLLDTARARPQRPLIATSVRDILQEGRKAGRNQETVDILLAYFDLAVVHGDPRLARLADSFPLAAAIEDRIVYSGLVGPGPAASGQDSGESFDVIVSVGGGAVGAALIGQALRARPLSRLREASWLVLTGPNAGPQRDIPDSPGVTLRAFEPDLPARLTRARLSISQAGYNTVADLLGAPACRAVLVPHAAGIETEQTRRASLMAERGWAVTVDEAVLDPSCLAEAIDAALDLPERATTFALDGAVTTGAILRDRMRHAVAN